MARISIRYSGGSEAAPAQMASLRSRVARFERISSRTPVLIAASGSLFQGLSRERGLALMARRANRR